MLEFIVYHGTASKNKLSIIDNGFDISTSIENEHWLGNGVYFFCDGVPPEPFIAAEKWVVVEAWDNEKYKNRYNKYVVLQSIIKVQPEYFLDLTSKDGLVIFNYLRDKYIESLKKERIRLSNGNYKDGHIIDDAISEHIFQIDAVKNNFYIKLSRDERVQNAQFRTPNCTIIAVKNTNCIHSTTIFKEDYL